MQQSMPAAAAAVRNGSGHAYVDCEMDMHVTKAAFACADTNHHVGDAHLPKRRTTHWSKREAAAAASIAAAYAAV